MLFSLRFPVQFGRLINRKEINEDNKPIRGSRVPVVPRAPVLRGNFGGSSSANVLPDLARSPLPGAASVAPAEGDFFIDFLMFSCFNPSVG